MSGIFEETFKTYIDTILAVHPKYSTAKYHDKTVETVNEVVGMVFTLLDKLNPEEMKTMNEMEFDMPADNDLNEFKKKKKGVVKVNKTVNPYTGIFLPITRDVIKPVLEQWDVEEPDICYNRITSVNSIASKVYKNLTNKDAYTDTYEYDAEAVEGKTKGIIKASASSPKNADKIMKKYANIVKQITDDKTYVETNLEDVPEEEIKEKKAELIESVLVEHKDLYASLNEYILECMNKYRTALRDLCVDKPQRKAVKSESESEPVKEKATRKPASKKKAPKEEVASSEPEPTPFSLPTVDMININLSHEPVDVKKNTKVPRKGVRKPAKK